MRETVAARIWAKYNNNNTPDGLLIPSSVPVFGVWLAMDCARKAGFTGDELVAVTAIAGRESRWNPWAVNTNERTGDRSFGLWQINTIQPSVWNLMREQLGLGLGELQLLDPTVNARAAKWLHDRSPDIPFRGWGPYKDLPPLWGYAARVVPVVVDVALFFGYISLEG